MLCELSHPPEIRPLRGHDDFRRVNVSNGVREPPHRSVAPTNVPGEPLHQELRAPERHIEEEPRERVGQACRSLRGLVLRRCRRFPWVFG
jgi:hypothetical protein